MIITFANEIKDIGKKSKRALNKICSTDLRIKYLMV